MPVFWKVVEMATGKYGLAVSSETWYLFIVRPGLFFTHVWHSLLYIALKGPKTLTSKDWVRRLAWGGNTKMITLCVFAHFVNVKGIWERCLWYRTKVGLVSDPGLMFAYSAKCLVKQIWKTSDEDHPLSDIPLEAPKENHSILHQVTCNMEEFLLH